MGNTKLNQLEIDIDNINEKEIFKDGKVIDLIIDSFSSIDLIFEDDDIWIFSLECLDEIMKNKNMAYKVKGNTFHKIYKYYLRVFSKLQNDKDKSKFIKEKLSFLMNNSLLELNLFLNFSSPLIPYNYGDKKYLMEI